MKKTVFFIVATWFACTVVSCEKRESPASEGIQKEVTIGCYTEVADVKTALSGNDTDGYNVVWKTGDQIRCRSVSPTKDYGSALTLKPAFDGMSIAEFGGSLNIAPDANAFEAQYPANYGGTTFSVTNQSAVIGEQNYREGGPDFYPMFARAAVASPEQLHFSNTMGIIRVELRNTGAENVTVKKINFSAATPMMGLWDNVKQSDGHYQAVYRASAKPLNLNCGDGGVAVPAGESRQFYVSALPGEYSEFSFTVTNMADKVFEVNMKDGKTFIVTRSRISPISIPVQAASFVTPVAGKEIHYSTTNGAPIDIYDEGDFFPIKGTKSATTAPVAVTSHTYDPATNTGIITLASTITTIGAEAFSGCTTLQSFRVSSSVTYIGEEAFQGCTGLQSVKLPKSVVTIQAAAFRNCTSLKTATIGSVTSLSQNTFYGCIALESIKLPQTLTKINTAVFQNCSSLKSITIPDKVSDLPGGNIFRDCTGLESIDLGNGGFKTIQGTTFKGCTSLTEITIPASVETIGNQAFFGCSSLATIRFKRSASATAPAAETNQTFISCKDPGVIIVPDGCLEAYVAAWRVGTDGTDYVPSYITIREESGRTEHDDL